VVKREERGARRVRMSGTKKFERYRGDKKTEIDK
jgi:hypothetical protein